MRLTGAWNHARRKASTSSNDDRDAVARLLRDERCTLGLSDAGAHVGQLCDAPQATDFLGNWVRDRKLLTLDLARLAREAEAARERLEALNAGMRDLYTKLEPVVASFCPALAAQPYHIRQYLCDAPSS